MNAPLGGILLAAFLLLAIALLVIVDSMGVPT